MMRKNNLLILSGVTLAVVAAASWAVMDRSPATAAPGTDVLLFADLAANDVTTLQVLDADGALTIQNVDDTWTLADRGGYPVALEKVKQAVLGLTQLTIEEKKTSRPENFQKLGVTEPGTEDSAAQKLTLKDASGTVVAAVILGETKFRRGSQGVYVRIDGEDQVYLCEGRLQIDSQPTSWIDRDILRLEGDRVASVQVLHPDGEEVLIGRDPENEAQFLLENVPPDREEKFAGVANSVGTALSYLSLEDVQPAGEVDFAAEPLAKTTYRCDDGLVIHAETARFEEATWIRLAAGYEEPPEPIGPPVSSDETDEAEDTAEGDEDSLEIPDETAPAEEDEPDPEAVRAEASEFNELWSPWAYKIQDYKGEVLARHLEELLAEVVEETPAEPEQPVDEGGLDLDEALDPAQDE
jgi:hypothetical protein